MKNYDEMSDFEINKLVAVNESLIVNNLQISHDGNSAVMVNDLVQSFKFDPCNVANDAWPIIVDNAISITSVGDLNWNADSIISIEEDADNYNHFQCISNCTSQNKNPLRAAMICFLKMKEAENA